ncbi:MAG: bifunctional folylpolyglutamate synthase/dihydrofolate synthase [Micavibrio sp.]|nr:bifunctional folylpolyglutamate synthase/dihydrofolate synthase [Micavibrio sp.]
MMNPKKPLKGSVRAMYESDLTHTNQTLEEKLHKLFTLNRHKAIDLSFRPPFLNLLTAFGEPQAHLPPIIHIAGTNGKGSTLAFMRAILERAGKSVHVYTSPHLKRFNERIVLAGEEIGDRALEGLIDEALALNAGGEVTFFEVTTAMAMAAFSRTAADYCLLETGMGGRLDCTNIVEAPLVCLINSISYDHTEYLGESIVEIAAEKAGIMKAGVPCVLGAQDDMECVLEVVEARADALGAPLYVFGRDWDFKPVEGGGFVFCFRDYSCTLPAPALVGAHQVCNSALALAGLFAANIAQKLPESALAYGVENAQWPARMEQIAVNSQLEVWFDGGHNVHAAKAIASQLQTRRSVDDKPLSVIFAMKDDKDYEGYLNIILPYVDNLIYIPLIGVGGCVDVETVRELSSVYEGITFESAENIQAALKVVEREGTDCRVLICGSLYLADQIR